MVVSGNLKTKRPIFKPVKLQTLKPVLHKHHLIVWNKNVFKQRFLLTSYVIMSAPTGAKSDNDDDDVILSAGRAWT